MLNLCLLFQWCVNEACTSHQVLVFVFQELYDKDIMINDFLGKVSLTLDQLKEISLKVSFTKQYAVKHC